MSDTVDRHTTFKANSHAAKRSSGFTCDRRPKSIDAGMGDRGRDGRALLDGDLDLVDGEFDQWPVMCRDGE